MPGRRDTTTRRPLPPGFFTIWSTVAIDLIGFGVIIPVLAIYAERFGTSAIQVGLLGSAYSLAQFVAAPLWGRLSDRIGRKPVLILSLVGTAAASVACGLAGSLTVLFIARALDGASGASMGAAQAAVSDIADPDDRPRLFGLLAAAFGVGFVIGPAIGGLAALWGPRVPFFVAGGLAAANAVAAWIRLPETRGARVEPSGAAVRDGADSGGPAPLGLARTWREAGIPFFVVTAFASVAAFSAFEWTFALFGQDRLDLTEASTAAVFVVIGLLISAVQGAIVPAASCPRSARPEPCGWACRWPPPGCSCSRPSTRSWAWPRPWCSWPSGRGSPRSRSPPPPWPAPIRPPAVPSSASSRVPAAWPVWSAPPSAASPSTTSASGPVRDRRPGPRRLRRVRHRRRAGSGGRASHGRRSSSATDPCCCTTDSSPLPQPPPKHRRWCSGTTGGRSPSWPPGWRPRPPRSQRAPVRGSASPSSPTTIPYGSSATTACPAPAGACRS